MHVIVTKDKLAGSRVASRFFTHKIAHGNAKGDNTTLGLATGSSPIQLYDILRSQKHLSFRNVTTFNLDEYEGLGPDDEDSYAFFMHKHLFNYIDINPENINLLDGLTTDYETMCNDYERKLRETCIDIQLLGIGHNGHIAFNEPVEEENYEVSLSLKTHRVKLSESTLEANAQYLSRLVTHAYTMGIGSILSAKQIVLLAWGERKGDVLNRALFGNEKLPVSCLGGHLNAKVIVDREAASQIDLGARLKTCVNASSLFTGERSDRSESDCQTVLIFSPHPDDDVIAMGATISKLVALNHRVVCVYQTSGSFGVKGVSRMAAKEIRRREAKHACSQLGVDECAFLDCDFYERSSGPEKLPIGELDIQVHVDCLDEYMPDVVFCAGDFSDPHGTHEKCTQALFAALEQSRAKPSEVWLYKGAWEEWGLDEVSLVVPFEKDTLVQKNISILLHESQTDTAYKGEDNRPFYVRAKERCEAQAKEYNALCGTTHQFIEIFAAA